MKRIRSARLRTRFLQAGFLTAFLALWTVITASPADPPWRFLTETRPPLDTSVLPKSALEKLARLHAGMTRRQVARDFTHDRGLIFLPVERYYLKDVPIPGDRSLHVMVEFVFQPYGMDDATFADQERRNAFKVRNDQDPRDVVKEVGKPYISALAWERPPRG